MKLKLYAFLQYCLPNSWERRMFFTFIIAVMLEVLVISLMLMIL